MKIKLYNTLIFSLLFLVTGSCKKEEIKKPYYGKAVITVLDSENNSLNAVNIILNLIKGDGVVLISSSTTDALGEISYEKLYPGNYEAISIIDGIIPDTIGFHIAANEISTVSLISKMVPEPEEEPVPSIKLPGKLNAVDFIENNGGNAEQTQDIGGGFHLGGNKLGNYYIYDVDIETEGIYKIDYRVTTARESSIKITIIEEGYVETELEEITLAASGGWNNWTTVTGNEVNLTAGRKKVRIDVISDGFNLNWLTFNLWEGYYPIPGNVLAINLNEKSKGGKVEDTRDIGGGQHLGGNVAGNFYIYDIDIKDDGYYNVNYRVTCARNATIKLSVVEDNTTKELESIILPATGGWNNWQTISGSDFELTKGKKQIRIDVISDGFNINWFNINKL